MDSLGSCIGALDTVNNSVTMEQRKIRKIGLQDRPQRGPPDIAT